MSADLQPRPVVAIVGRPNVGKSSLFNRMAGKRIAIVHEQPGVTRDRVTSVVRAGNRSFELVDTGGLEDAERPRGATAGSMEAAVRRQVELCLSEAQAVIFAVDVKAGVTLGDEKACALLRGTGLPVLIAANKADNAALDLHAADFNSFGFPVFPVSALHNRGMAGLFAELARLLPEGGGEDMPRLRVALVGRPNVGKSLLANRLAGSERLIVSDEPGTTRDSVAIPLASGSGAVRRGYLLIDTAGLRRAGKNKSDLDKISQARTRATISSADVVALVLDASTGPTAYDKQIMALIAEARKGCLLIVNKWDLARSSSLAACRAALRREMPFADFAPLLCVSALTGANVGGILEAIDRVAEQNRQRIPTGILNRAIQLACSRYQAPVAAGGRLKIFYATQTNIQPITFLLFVNDPSRLSKNYERYLIGCLRRSFGLEGAPIVLNLRKRQPREPGQGNRIHETAEHQPDPQACSLASRSALNAHPET